MKWSIAVKYIQIDAGPININLILLIGLRKNAEVREEREGPKEV